MEDNTMGSITNEVDNLLTNIAKYRHKNIQNEIKEIDTCLKNLIQYKDFKKIDKLISYLKKESKSSILRDSVKNGLFSAYLIINNYKNEGKDNYNEINKLIQNLKEDLENEIKNINQIIEDNEQQIVSVYSLYGNYANITNEDINNARKLLDMAKNISEDDKNAYAINESQLNALSNKIEEIANHQMKHQELSAEDGPNIESLTDSNESENYYETSLLSNYSESDSTSITNNTTYDVKSLRENISEKQKKCENTILLLKQYNKDKRVLFAYENVQNKLKSVEKELNEESKEQLDIYDMKLIRSTNDALSLFEEISDKYKDSINDIGQQLSDDLLKDTNDMLNNTPDNNLQNSDTSTISPVGNMQQHKSTRKQFKKRLSSVTKFFKRIASFSKSPKISYPTAVRNTTNHGMAINKKLVKINNIDELMINDPNNKGASYPDHTKNNNASNSFRLPTNMPHAEAGDINISKPYNVKINGIPQSTFINSTKNIKMH